MSDASAVMGRPSSYAIDTAEAICTRIECGEGIVQICRDPDMPGERTVYQWLDKHPSFAQMYARAREIQADHFVDEIIEISDDARNDWMAREGEPVVDHENVQRSKLRVDSRKWAAAKLSPRKYSDRLEHVGAGGKDLIPERAADPERVAHAVLLLLQSAAPRPVLTIEASEDGSTDI